MSTHRQSTSRTLTAWLLSLLMLCSPLLAQAHTWAWQSEADQPVSGQMPCHQDQDQQPVQPSCPHCDESGMSPLCDCCEQALSPSLLSRSSLQTGLFMPRGEIVIMALLTRPDPPPTGLYRPPINS